MAWRLRVSARVAGLAAGSMVAAGAAAESWAQIAVDAIEVAWDAPEGCPGAAHVDAAVDRLLGGAPPVGDRRMRVRGTVTRDAGGHALALDTEDERGRRGRRNLSAATCEALADAAALVVALGWDPAAVAAARALPAGAAAGSEAPAPPPPPPAPISPTPVPTPPPAPPPAWRPPARPRARPERNTDAVAALGVSVAVDAGGLPSIAAGFTGWASVLLGAYRIELGATGFPGAEGALDADPSRGGRFGQLVGVVAGCRAIVPWAGAGIGHELGACVGMEVGATFASGFGVDQERDATRPWVAPRAGPAGRLALPGGVGVRGDLHLAVPILRDTFLLDDLGSVHQPAPVVGRVGVGLDLRF